LTSVINTDEKHPAQVLADLLVVKEAKNSISNHCQKENEKNRSPSRRF
jgi:ornithine carbamoyltransferase